jgi:rare lipoprotein A
MMSRVEGDRTGGLPRAVAAIGLCLLVANCASSNKFAAKVDPKYGVSSSPRVVDAGQPVPKGGGTYRVGKPYVVAGRTYIPEENASYRDEGLASWYGDDFHGRLTANGEVFDKDAISAAHPTLPLPSYVRVTNLANRRSIIVRVNDRGPYHGNRVIDVSHKAASLLGFRENGIARVSVEYVGRAPLEGTDDRILMATLRQNGPAPAPSPMMVASAQAFPLPPQGGRRGASLRDTPPFPVERPYTLGEEQAEQSVRLSRATSTDMAAMPRRTGSDDGLGAARRMAVSTSAPARYDPVAAYLSGRGLY